MRKRYTKADMAPFIGDGRSPNPGLKPLPNAEDVDPLQFLQSLAAHGHMMESVWGWALLSPPEQHRQQWTQFFLMADANMAFEFGGGGYAVTYGQKTPIVRRFRLCKHEIVLAAGADPSRGWRPGCCKHCGMDMTINSGD